MLTDDVTVPMPMNARLNDTWTDDLNDTTSDTYQDLAEQARDVVSLMSINKFKVAACGLVVIFILEFPI